MEKTYKLLIFFALICFGVNLYGQCDGEANFTYEVIEKRKTQFKSNQEIGSHEWEIFDKGAKYTAANPLHSFSNFGNYRVCHYITVYDTQNAKTCKDTFCNWVTLNATCTLDGEFDLNLSEKTVDAVSKHPDLENSWYIGKDSLQTGDTLYYTFDNFGTYNICHVVRYYDSILMRECLDSVCKTITIFDNECNADFSYTNIKGDYEFSSVDTAQASNHSWTFGDGNNSKLTHPKHSFAFDSSFTVCHVVKKFDNQLKLLCKDSLCKSIPVEFVSIEEMEHQTALIFPNPVKDKLEIILPRSFEGSVIIVNSLGTQVFSKKINIQTASSYFISVEELCPGLYWLMTYNNTSSKVYQFIKE